MGAVEGRGANRAGWLQAIDVVIGGAVGGAAGGVVENQMSLQLVHH